MAKHTATFFTWAAEHIGISNLIGKRLIIKILRRRYGDGLVKKVRKFEKFDFKYWENLLDLKFLQSCKKEKLIPTFLQFKVAIKRLESSEAYLSCQRGVY